jgi:hypothetical protein
MSTCGARLSPCSWCLSLGQSGYQFSGKSTGELLRRIIRTLSNYLSEARSEITIFILREDSCFAVTNSVRQVTWRIFYQFYNG